MLINFFTLSFFYFKLLHRKNDFAEISENLVRSISYDITKLFSDRYKFLDTSAKPFFYCRSNHRNIRIEIQEFKILEIWKKRLVT